MWDVSKIKLNLAQYINGGMDIPTQKPHFQGHNALL